MNTKYGSTCGKIDIENAYTLDSIFSVNYYTYFKLKETNLKGYHSKMFDLKNDKSQFGIKSFEAQ